MLVKVYGEYGFWRNKLSNPSITRRIFQGISVGADISNA